MYDYDRRLARVTRPFDARKVAEIQKDLATFLSNIDRVKSPADLERLEKLALSWGKEFRKDYDNLILFLRDQAINDPKVKSIDRQMDVWRRKGVNYIFNAYSAVSSIPSDWEYWTGDGKWTWKRKLEKALAQLPDAAKWLESIKKRKIVPVVPDVTEHLTRLEGFNVKLVGYDENDPDHAGAMGRLKAGLKQYRQKASRVFPTLLRHAFPMTVRFDVEDILGAAGYGGSGSIELFPLNIRSVDMIVYTVAHEMTHVVDDLLPQGARAFWIQMFKGDLGEIDLNDVLKAWPVNAPNWMGQNLKDTDPVFYLQVQALMSEHTKPPKELKDNWTRDALEAYLANGGNPKVQVHMHPITAYGTSAPNEALAEAIALLVTHGPRALDPQVTLWLKNVFPGQLKLASFV